MDWRYNTIWFDQVDKDKILHCNFQESELQTDKVGNIEYAMFFHFKHKGLSFEPLPELPKLLFLDMTWGNMIDFGGINKYEKLKRLELHYCVKLKNDSNISSLKDTLEFLHINQSKKFTPTDELLKLKNLKVLCLNACGPLESLDFLRHFPNLIDFRFVDTKVLDGDLTPILNHPTIRAAGFLNKRNYNFTDKEIKGKLDLKSKTEFKEIVHKGQYSTFKYRYTGD